MLNQEERVTVGLVGAGAVTRGVHLPVLKNLGRAEVVWVADVDGAAARKLAADFGVPRAVAASGAAALPTCDIALLAVPLHVREPYLEHFASHRISLLAEKPFAISAGDHQRYLDLFGTTAIACGYMRRSYSSVRSLRRIVRSGWFGSLRAIRYAEGGRSTSSEYASATLDLSHHQGGGVLRDLGCHGLDAIGFVTGASDFTVHESRISWDGETDRHVAARFGIGTTEVEYVVSWLTDQTNTIELEFERGLVRCGTRPDATLAIDGIEVDFREPGARSAYQAFFLQWDAVLRALPGGTDSDFSASSSLWTTKLVEALYRAGGAP